MDSTEIKINTNAPEQKSSGEIEPKKTEEPQKKVEKPPKPVEEEQGEQTKTAQQDTRPQRVKMWMVKEQANNKTLQGIIENSKHLCEAQAAAYIQQNQSTMTGEQKAAAMQSKVMELHGHATSVIIEANRLVDYGDVSNDNFKVELSEAKIADARRMLYDELVNKGLLDSSDAEQIVNMHRERQKFFQEGERVNPILRGLDRDSLAAWAKNAGIVLQPDQVEFINALQSENAADFETELNKEKYRKTDANGNFVRDQDGDFEFDIEKFWEQVRDICEEAISVVDLQPDLFFEQAFDPFYHARFYNQFMSEMRAAAFRLQAKDDTRRTADKKIDIEVFENPADPNRKDQGFGHMDVGKSPVTYTGSAKINLSDAIAASITGHMAEFRDVYQYLHDADKIIQEGAGWETLAKYAEKAKTSSMDWFFKQDKDMSLAYNLYIPSLKQVLYLNNRIAKPNLNYSEHRYGLELAQSRALLKMDAIKGEEEPVAPGVETRRRLRNIRRIKLGSAAAKAYTFEYWNVWNDIAMPQTFEIVDDPRYPGGKRVEFRVDAARVDAGIDKMKTAMDWEGTARQFKLPREFWALPYVYIPRNFDKFDPFHHAMIYESKKMAEDATFRGATDEYLEFFPKYETLGDNLRSGVLGFFTRMNWRTREYRRFIFVDDDNHLDFARSVANLMTVGTPALNAFIDEMKHGVAEDYNFKLIDDATYYAITGGHLPANRDSMTYDQSRKYIEAFQTAMYKEFFFKKIMNLTPTKVLQLERRRYTPFGEKLVIEDLWDYLNQKYQGQLSRDLIKETLTPLFVEALELAQNEKMKQVFAAAPNVRDIQGLRQMLDNRFTAADLQNDRVREIIRNYFNQYKDSIPQLHAYQGQSGLDFLNDFDTFYQQALPGFLNELKRSIAKPRKDKALGMDRNGQTFETAAYRNAPWLDQQRNGRPGEYGLTERFINWRKIGLLKNEFGGEDLDFTRFFFQRGGNRVSARMCGENNLVVTKSVENGKKMFETVAPSFTQTQYADDRQLAADVEKKLVPIINEMRDAWGAADAGHKARIVSQMEVFLERVLGKDSADGILGISNDVPFLGDAMDNFMRRLNKSEGSLYQDYYVSRLDRPTTAFNNSQKEAMMRTILNKGDVPWEQEAISKTGYRQEKGLFGIKTWVPDINYRYDFETRHINLGPLKIHYKWPVKKQVGEPEKTQWAWTAQNVKKVTGHEGAHKFWKSSIEMMAFIAILIFINMNLAASKANEKK